MIFILMKYFTINIPIPLVLSTCTDSFGLFHMIQSEDLCCIHEILNKVLRVGQKVEPIVYIGETCSTANAWMYFDSNDPFRVKLLNEILGTNEYTVETRDSYSS